MPALVGYSSGATLAYAALVQAPANTFRGAISLGFCPDLEVRRPFCKGHGLVSQPTRDGKGVLFAPAAELAAPWIALQGDVDKVCDPKQTADFVARVGRGELVTLDEGRARILEPGALAGAAARGSGQARRRPRPRRPRSPPTSPTCRSIELPAKDARDRRARGGPLRRRRLGQHRPRGRGALVERGVSVVGFDCLQYFWTARTPDQSGDALARVVRHYLGAWHSRAALLIGYSRGADVLPFMASRLPADLRARVALVALLGPALSVEFEFHVADWLGGRGSGRALPIPPELAKLRGLRLLCIYGRDERESLCRGLDPALGTARRAARRPPLRRRLRRDRAAHPRPPRAPGSGNVAQAEGAGR